MEDQTMSIETVHFRDMGEKSEDVFEAALVVERWANRPALLWRRRGVRLHDWSSLSEQSLWMLSPYSPAGCFVWKKSL